MNQLGLSETWKRFTRSEVIAAYEKGDCTTRGMAKVLNVNGSQAKMLMEKYRPDVIAVEKVKDHGGPNDWWFVRVLRESGVRMAVNGNLVGNVK